MDLEYWRNRYNSSINYDTMVGWDEQTIADETSLIFAKFYEMTNSCADIKKVCDYGCGRGRFAPLFKVMGIGYIGVDILREAVDSNNIKYTNMFKSIYEYNQDDISDLIFLCTTFQYFDDEEANISLSSEFAPAKHIFIVESLAPDGVVLRSHEHNRKPDQIKELVEKNGWTIKKESYLNSRESYYLLWASK